MYENGLNGDIRARRADPNVLAEGDLVWIDRFERVEVRPTEARHRFETVTAQTTLRLRLERMKPSRYTLAVDGTTFERPLPESRLIEHPIPPGAKVAELRLFFDDVPRPYHLAWRLDLGAMRPVDQVRGVKERLNNLGLGAGSENEHQDALTQGAVGTFQKTMGEPPTGVLDDALREKVRKTHDVG